MEKESDGNPIESNQVHKFTPKKQIELDEVLRLFSLGFKKKYIRNKLNLSKSNFSNYLGKLEEMGCIKRIGKYEVQFLSSSLIHPRVTQNLVNSKLNKRGHAHNFKVIFPQETEGLKDKSSVKSYLVQEHKRKPEVLKFGSVRIPYKKYTIWINKESLTIYSNNSYYSQDALQSKFRALKDLDTTIQYLKHKFGFKGIYGIEIFREHYGLIFNKFAEWILAKGGKMEVKNKGNKSILWVDDSKEDDIGLKEFEGCNPLDVNNADKYFEDQEKTNWKIGPSFILETLNKQNQQTQKLIDSQLMDRDNLIRHHQVLESILETQRLQQQTLKLIQERLNGPTKKDLL